MKREYTGTTSFSGYGRSSSQKQHQLIMTGQFLRYRRGPAAPSTGPAPPTAPSPDATPEDRLQPAPAPAPATTPAPGPAPNDDDPDLPATL